MSTVIRNIIILCLLAATICVAENGETFELEVLTATMTQIVLQWENEPSNTTSFTIQRATNSGFTQNLKTYSIDLYDHIFSDTDRPIVSSYRFNGWPYFGAPLNPDTVFYYRVKASLSDGESQYSNIVSAKVSGPIRGIEGDLWADIVLGQSSFGSNVIGKPTKYATFYSGGVVIDKSVRPNRMYIADCNNNRILGFAYLGVTELGLTNAQNFARNRTYTKSSQPSGTYPDTNNREFNDGILSTNPTNSFGYYFSNSGYVDIDVDLGSVKEINFAVYSTGGGNPNNCAGSTTIFVSENGADWNQVAAETNPDLNAEQRMVFAATNARYVRFRGTPNAVPGWLFIGEGQVGMLTPEKIAEKGNPCSVNSDCLPGNFCVLTPERGADIVIGQPDFGSSAGNGDSCAQTFPYRAQATASTLCLTYPTQISMGETIVCMKMAVDAEGSLYVPDVFNNRILKYIDPFNTDTVADEVWGQADFTHVDANRGNNGGNTPSANSLRFEDSHKGSLTFDFDGNMWVVDIGNHRVLRFPKDPVSGAIAKTADMVLGQSSFSTRNIGRTLSTMYYPRDAEFDYNGRLYVSDGESNNFSGRIVIFDPPFYTGMSATEVMPIPRDNDPYFGPSTVVGIMLRDKVPNRMWFAKNTFITELIDLEYSESISYVNDSQLSSLDLDCDGNLFVDQKWSGNYRYPYTSWNLTYTERGLQKQLVFPEGNPGNVAGNSITADSMGGIIGITTFGSQFLIAERGRILIWNNYDIDNLTTGQAADEVYGQPDFNTMNLTGAYASIQVDSLNRLWALHTYQGFTLKAFQYPLTHSSTAVRNVVIRNGEENVLNVKGGGTTKVAMADFVDFAVVDSGDKIWVADQNMNRIIRINNINGYENPLGVSYVDIVLGQNNITDGEINAGQGSEHPGPQTLDKPYNVGISADGDLFISDNGGEVGSNRRILRFNKNRFPNNPATCLFASDIGDPDSVIGTGGSFVLPGYMTNDPMCCPFELGLHPQSTIVAGMNGYSAQRFPLVYIDPITNTMPQMALADMTSYPSTCFIDADGNVYMGDWDWYRVLIWKKPFKNVNDYFSILSINPVASTENSKTTWKSRRSRSYKVFWTDDELGSSTVWNEATGIEAEQTGTGNSLEFTDNGATTFGDAEHAPLEPGVSKRCYIVKESRE